MFYHAESRPAAARLVGRKRLVASLCLVYGCCVAVNAQSGFVPLPFTDDIASVESLSGDGSIAVGWFRDGNSFLSPTVGFRWSVAGGYTSLLPQVAGNSCFAFGTNFTGSIACGDSESNGVTWSSASNFAPVSAGVSSRVVDISGNGSVRITRTQFNTGGAWTALAALPSPHVDPELRRVSADGGQIAATVFRRVQTGSSGYGGPIFSNFARIAVYNPASGAWTIVEPLPDYENISALSISADGRVSVGTSTDQEGALPQRAVRSTDGGLAVSIGALSPADGSTALDVSADGSVIVGRSGSTAFVWTAADGMRSVQSVLTANGVDLGGFTLTSAKAVSDNGQIVVGTGTDPQGRQRQWMADITVVCTAVGPSVPVTATFITMSGQSDGAGSTFDTTGFQTTIEPSGAIAFFGRRQSDLRSGLYFADGQPSPTVTPVSIPGIVGPYALPESAVLASATSIAFLANDSRAIVAGDPRGVISTVVAAGQPAPAPWTGTFDGAFPFQSLLLSSSGAIAFQARIAAGQFGNVGAFRLASGTFSSVFFQAVPAFGGTSIFNPVLLALTAGNVMLWRGTDQSEALFVLAAGTGNSLPARLINGSTLSNSPLTVRSLDQTVTAGDHIVASVFLSNNKIGLVHVSSLGERTLLATIGDSTGGPGSPVLSFMSSQFTITPSGMVYFYAAAGGQPSQHGGIYRTTVGAPRTIAPVLLRGATVPGAICRTVSEISQVLNSGGERLLLHVSLGIVGEPAAGSALVLIDPTAGLVPLLTSGDIVQIAPGVSTPVVSVLPPTRSNTTGDDGLQTQVAASGAAAARFTLAICPAVLAGCSTAVVRVSPQFVSPPVGCAIADVASDSLDTVRNPNNSIGPEDLDAFIAGFIAGNAAIADVASDSLDTVYTPNGFVGPEDLDAFIASFIAGC